jgi:hypothetical protein
MLADAIPESGFVLKAGRVLSTTTKFAIKIFNCVLSGMYVFSIFFVCQKKENTHVKLYFSQRDVSNMIIIVKWSKLMHCLPVSSNW